MPAPCPRLNLMWFNWPLQLLRSDELTDFNWVIQHTSVNQISCAGRPSNWKLLPRMIMVTSRIMPDEHGYNSEQKNLANKFKNVILENHFCYLCDPK